MSSTPELLHGTLDVMILSVLGTGAADELHGYGIARAIERRSGRVLTIEEGSLYPALHRLEKAGALESEWRRTDTGRRAKFYRLTSAGQRQLTEQAGLWATLSAAVDRVVRGDGDAPATAPAGGVL